MLLQVRHIDRFVERAEHEGPLARTRWTKLYLDGAGRSLEREAVGDASAVTYETMGAGVDFATAPFSEGTEITGPIATRLFVSSATTDVDSFVTARLFDRAGKEVVFLGALDPNTPLAKDGCGCRRIVTSTRKKAFPPGRGTATIVH